MITRVASALSICALLYACGGSSDGRKADRVLGEIARADHAARCLQLTAAVARLAAGTLRVKATELELARITPELASRWIPLWEDAAREAEMSPKDAARNLSGQVVVIEDEAALNSVADEAFECGSELDAASGD